MKVKISYLNDRLLVSGTGQFAVLRKRTERGETMPDHMYNVIFSGEISESENDAPGTDPVSSMLECLFAEFNGHGDLGLLQTLPRNRSMSVNDVIEIDGVGFICAPAGWKKVDNTERDLLNACVATGLI